MHGVVGGKNVALKPNSDFSILTDSVRRNVDVMVINAAKIHWRWQSTFRLQTTSLNQIIKRFGEMFIKIYISIANCCTSEKCSSMRKDSRIRVKISSTYCVFVILCMKCVKCYISTIFLETTKLHSVYLSIYLKIYLWNKTFAHPLYFISCNNETGRPLAPIWFNM